MLRCRKRTPLESHEQEAVIGWSRYVQVGGVSLSTYILASMNGMPLPGDDRQRAILIAAMKRRGMKPGTPDLMVALMRGGYGALFGEMKRRGGTASDVSKEQREMHERLRSAGYLVETWFGFDEARLRIMQYLTLGGQSHRVVDRSDAIGIPYDFAGG